MMTFQGKKLRHELKYYVHAHEYVRMRGEASRLMRLDDHSVGDAGYGIRSLYFDGVHDHALHDKANGIFKRDKYRIRVYNGSKDRIMLERKSKFGDMVCKEGALLAFQEYESIIRGDYLCLADKKDPLLKDFYYVLAHRAYRPAVIVDYVREAYIFEEGNVRLTFDKRLSAAVNSYDLFDKALILNEALQGPVTIMELKYDSFLPAPVRPLIQPGRHVRSAISKYLICRTKLLSYHKE
ncbi:polyphosphate polymerase domain-containing protein [Paenibacillus thailandensis]|uniref:Polyphosphate polymerase domain-containing protein n=1 Tax=Paenibacillus thailandensis TaxID=393250 RepID=A0ABW5QUM1_9BACL